jgi:hypothetical protein
LAGIFLSGSLARVQVTKLEVMVNVKHGDLIGVAEEL